MGVLELVAGPLAEQVSQRGWAVVIASGFTAFIVLSVVLNVLKQILFKNSNEPPIVFHWFPIIGSTVTYGMDPYAFFFANRAKVCSPENRSRGEAHRLIAHSMAMSLRLFFSERRLLSA